MGKTTGDRATGPVDTRRGGPGGAATDFIPRVTDDRVGPAQVPTRAPEPGPLTRRLGSTTYTSSTAAPPAPVEAPAKKSRRRWPWITLVAVVVILAVATGSVFVLRPAALFGPAATTTNAASQPAAPPPSPVLAPAPTDAPLPTGDAVSTALRGPLADGRLGNHVAVQISDVLTGQSLFTQNATDAVVPASTMKLVTSVAVLAVRGPAYQIQTTAVAGTNPGEVVLVGGGDPTLALNATGSYPGAARLDDLAAQVKSALGDTAPTKVIVDSSLFSGANTGPNWENNVADGFGYTARITPLMLDGGRLNPRQLDDPSPRSGTPDITAGQAFARQLGLPASAVTTGRAPTATTTNPAPSGSGTPAPGTRLGVVSSAPLVRILEQMLSNSDNTVAEMMARQVALGRHQPASFAGAGAAVLAQLGDLGLPTAGVHTADGSGLSFDDRLTPQLLTAILALAAKPDQPALHALFTGLPVAGYSGTLATRYHGQGANPAGGDLRAKTGTLPGVNSLAGYVVDAKGRLLAFAAMADRVTAGILPAETALDRIGTALATVG